MLSCGQKVIRTEQREPKQNKKTKKKDKRKTRRQFLGKKIPRGVDITTIVWCGHRGAASPDRVLHIQNKPIN